MTRSHYAASFIAGSLGLPQGQLGPEDVPGDLVDEIASAMRGTPPADTSSPSIESRILEFLAELERRSIEERGFFVRKARWPDALPFAVCLTHDVDNIERPREHIEKVRDRFSDEDLRSWRRGELSLYDNVELIGGKEAALGFRSSFYFMSAEYPLAKVKPAARRLHSRGWEVGLHGDFGTHDSKAKMAAAVERLRKGVGVRPRGLREHYLRFDYAKSWRVMQDCGFDYDSTVGNNDRLGFKLGLAAPFHPPDREWKAMRLLELPLSLMDTTLWGYLKKSEAEGAEDVTRMMVMTAEVGGLFTLLWHQESVRMRGGRIYWDVLSRIKGSGCFVGSGLEISKWWRQREVPLRVSRDGKLITLGGTPPPRLAIELKAPRGSTVRLRGGRTAASSFEGDVRSDVITSVGRTLRVELPDV